MLGDGGALAHVLAMFGTPGAPHARINGNEFAKILLYFTVDGAIWHVSVYQTALKLDLRL